MKRNNGTKSARGRGARNSPSLAGGKRASHRKITDHKVDLEILMVEKILVETLALYLLKKSNVPIRELVAGLLEIETQAGRLVMKLLDSEEGTTIKEKPSGLLTQVLTCLPLSGAMNSRTPKDR